LKVYKRGNTKIKEKKSGSNLKKTTNKNFRLKDEIEKK
jgi:hypothetical protein